MANMSVIPVSIQIKQKTRKKFNAFSPRTYRVISNYLLIKMSKSGGG